MLRWLGRTCARHHWVVIGLWLVAVVGGHLAASTWGGETTNDFSVPGSDSDDALEVLSEDFPQLAGTQAQVVFATPSGKTVTDYEDGIQQAIANLETIDGVDSVSNPLSATTELLNNQSSPNGTIAYATVLFPDEASELPDDTYDQIVAASKPARDAGLDVQYGGNLVDTQNPPTSSISDHADEIGLAVALVLLLLVFRSLLVALLPIVNALVGVLVAGAVVSLLEAHVTIPDVGATLGTMLGLGVGVDYSLFVLTRAYGEIEDGADRIDALGTALGTAGRAVVFAGTTVCLATVALLLVGIPLITQMGLVAALYVALSVLAATTLVPALGGAVGPRLVSWRVGRPLRMAHPRDTGLFAGLGRLVTRHPVVVVLVAVAALGVLASPVRDLTTGWVGDDADPPEMTQKKAYDLLAHGLGPGVNGELIVVARTGTVDTSDAVDVVDAATALQQALAATPGVKTTSPPFPDTTDSAPTAFAIEVQPTTGPDAGATSDLVRTLRSETIPQAVAGTDISGDVHVGGLTATIIDLDDTIADALPVFMAFVLGGAFLLLLLVFRSVLVGIKAVVMNLLTIGATFGVLVAVFQWGWLADQIGMTMDVDIVSFVPLLVFAIVFGLSMDYEVFLMSGMQEAHLRSGDPRAAVARALGTTGRVIVSAALVMFAVFVSFVSNPSPMVKQIGLGLAVGVLIDALVVRLLLVPAIMRLLGRAGWWMPRWLDRVLPSASRAVGVERTTPTTTTKARAARSTAPGPTRAATRPCRRPPRRRPERRATPCPGARRPGAWWLVPPARGAAGRRGLGRRCATADTAGSGGSTDPPTRRRYPATMADTAAGTDRARDLHTRQGSRAPLRPAAAGTRPGVSP